MDKQKKRADLPLKYRYNRAWAGIVVKKLTGRYARATKLLGEQFDFDSGDLVDLLATGSPFWAIFRDCIKYTEKWLQKESIGTVTWQLSEYTIQMFSSIEVKSGTYLQYCDDFDLTDFREWLRLKSQGIKGGTRGEKRVRSPTPYVPRKEMEEARRKP